MYTVEDRQTRNTSVLHGDPGAACRGGSHSRRRVAFVKARQASVGKLLHGKKSIETRTGSVLPLAQNESRRERNQRLHGGNQSTT